MNFYEQECMHCLDIGVGRTFGIPVDIWNLRPCMVPLSDCLYLVYAGVLVRAGRERGVFTFAELCLEKM